MNSILILTDITPGAGEELELTEGQQDVDIHCVINERGTINFWFRALDNSGMEFISSFSPEGISKVPSQSSSFKQTSVNKITLKSFKKDEDSGLYSCASLHKNTLIFGQVTRVVGGDFA